MDNYWITSYKPKTQFLPKSKKLIFKTKILNIYFDKVNKKRIFNKDKLTYPLNLLGNSSSFKWIIIQLIIYKIYGVYINDFKDTIYRDDSDKIIGIIKVYRNIYLVDFKKINCVYYTKIIRQLSKLINTRSFALIINGDNDIFDGNKLIILRNIDLLKSEHFSIIKSMIEKKSNFHIISSGKNSLSLNFYKTFSNNILLKQLNDNEFIDYYKTIVKTYNIKYVNSETSLLIFKDNYRNIKTTLLIIQGLELDDKLTYNMAIDKKLVVNILNCMLQRRSNNYKLMLDHLYLIDSLNIEPSKIISISIELIMNNKNLLCLSNNNKKKSKKDENKSKKDEINKKLYKIIKKGAEIDNKINISNNSIFGLENYFLYIMNLISQN